MVLPDGRKHEGPICPEGALLGKPDSATAAIGQCKEHGRIRSRLSAMSQHERDIVEARIYQHLPEPLLCCLFPRRKDTQF